MEYQGYFAHVTFDDEFNIFHGEVTNIRDVITFQGRSVEELRQAFHDSIEDYIEFCRERGVEPERPFSGKITLQLTPEQHRKILFAAEHTGKNMETWVIETLEHAVVV